MVLLTLRKAVNSFSKTDHRPTPPLAPAPVKRVCTSGMVMARVLMRSTGPTTTAPVTPAAAEEAKTSRSLGSAPRPESRALCVPSTTAFQAPTETHGEITPE
eukprot:CAMPEP_0115748024 /NCGR_PEP_ID=MMETSP0272-20121206/93462_1 /TAXON_ID=71861 /ORGANISM="Scrippsiella trochoidea, Strain CCMP3099" /LENGTH=101 /DNA_ID=CAMNT_0003193029 /DNA_START=569 /DNA_END=874 /DNA_ORIENTATION=-